MVTVTASNSPKHFLLKALNNCYRPLFCWQQDFLLLICPGIYPQIYHRTPCPAVLICKRVKKKKKQRRRRIISNFANAKGETFSSLMTTKLLLVVISQCDLHDKGLPLLFVVAIKTAVSVSWHTTPVSLC